MDVLPTPDQDLGWRLARLEDRLEGISERLGRLETSLRDAVAGEVHGATAELRRAISELGRRLVQDLPAELARHRDAIVAELRPPPSQPTPPPPIASAEQVGVSAPEATPPSETVAVDDRVEKPETAETHETHEAAERRRASRRRRRQG
jgi:hypothetical protein